MEGNTKLAILMIKTGIKADEGKEILQKQGGRLKDAIAAVEKTKRLRQLFLDE